MEIKAVALPFKTVVALLKANPELAAILEPRAHLLNGITITAIASDYKAAAESRHSPYVIDEPWGSWKSGRCHGIPEWTSDPHIPADSRLPALREGCDEGLDLRSAIKGGDSRLRATSRARTSFPLLPLGGRAHAMAERRPAWAEDEPVGLFGCYVGVLKPDKVLHWPLDVLPQKWRVAAPDRIG